MTDLNSIRRQMWQQGGNTPRDTGESRIYSAEVQPLNTFIPMSVAASVGAVYVRECYPKYYAFIRTAMLSGRSLITLTGTPGIGKSYFYSYFFDRFREENPKVTVVTASFSCDRTLMYCREYPPGEREGLELDQIPVRRNILYLYDGPPAKAVEKAFLICFTSPNASWLRNVRKDGRHLRLYMPVWTYDELIDAAELLSLPLSEDKVRDRFGFFGGVARYCLSVYEDDSYVEDAELAVREKIQDIDDIREVERSLDSQRLAEELSHHIFHTKPVQRGEHSLPSQRELFVASDEIIELLDKCLLAAEDHKVIDYVRMIQGTQHSSALIGWLFEAFAVRKFTKGEDALLAVSLDDGSQMPIVMAPGSFVRMKRANFPAVDGLIHDERSGATYLFQMTRAETHPVKGAGIWQLLETRNELHLLEQESKVVLVFVVPENRKDFPKQKIEIPDVTKGDETDVAAVPGIGPVGLSSLKKRKLVETVGVLSAKIDADESLEPYRQGLETFRAWCASPKLLVAISKIKQFRLVIKEKF